ncbi:uncharacterized protein LOC119079267 [Bradysia coprophila]|uniref:uncharacterized protein LOC119079267 n=1 Tax=Bradysia coprophila TaxID=38358 RepID=UPI00187DAF9C|nr:uncharacterized protein LOC119079267 [Bradysia coprophila]
MVYTCCVMRCSSNGNMVGRKFFRFPMIDHHSANSLAKSEKRQKAWLNALKKPNFPERHYKNAKVCDRHFVSGRSANLHDVSNIDWIPTLNLGYSIEKTNDRAVTVQIGSGETFTIVEVDDPGDKVKIEEQTVTDDVVTNCANYRDSGSGTQTYSESKDCGTNAHEAYHSSSSSTDSNGSLRTTRGTQTKLFESETIGTQTGSKSFCTSATQTDDADTKDQI